MSFSCDEGGEMQRTDALDDLPDEAIESLLAGRAVPAAGAGLDSLAELARTVRTVAERPVPRPNASLAAALSAGFSTEKGDLLVTAASNVPGPAATQAAGLPKWRKPHSMLPVTGPLTGMVAKIVAGITAGLAGLTAAGAAGALPGPAQHAVATVINSVSPLNIPDGKSSATVSANVNPTGPSVSAEAGANTPAGSTGAGATVSPSNVSASANAGTGAPGPSANANAGANVSTPGIPGLPGNLSNLPGLSNLPVQIPQCVKDIVDVKTGQPKVPLGQIATQVIACVKSLISMSTAQLPAGANQCVSSILGLVGSISTNPGSVPNLAGFDWSQCVPVDVTKCMSSVIGMMQGFMGFIPGFGAGASAGAGGSGANANAGAGVGIPGMPNLSNFVPAGCLPFDLNACLSSIFSMAGNLPGVPTGGVPGLGAGSLPNIGNIDLSKCVPIGSMGSIPGLGSLSSFLPR